MLVYAVKMLMGDRAKFTGILLGLTFASFIITQQSGIFIGLMQRTYGFLTDTAQPDIWVMEKAVQYIDDIKPFKISKLYQTRSISGVKWAVPVYKGLLKARMQGGTFQICNVIGIDDPSLIGGPGSMLEGSVENLRYPDGVIVNKVGATKKLAHILPNGKKNPLQMGDVFEINDHRVKVVGLCHTTRTFQSQPVIYTTFSKALSIAPSERDLLSFVLVKAQEHASVAELTKVIEENTGLAAYTTKQFRNLTVNYYLTQTGIPINFGVAVLLGFIIGAAIAGQTFYSYVHDHLRFFATFKAMGATNKLLIKMVTIQALVTATLGWSFGVGLTVVFGAITTGSELSFTFPWWLFVASGVLMYCMTLLAALISMLKIIRLEPAIVFQL